MAKKIDQQAHEKKNHPTLEVNPRTVREGDLIIVRGSRWGDCPVKIEIGGKAAKPLRVAQGFPVSDGVQPDANGSFVITLATLGIKPGRHTVVVTSTHRIHKASASESVDVSERPQFDPQREVEEQEEELAFWRGDHFFKRRFGHLGFVPPGMRETQITHIRLLRERRDRIKQRDELRKRFIEDLELEPTMPIPGVCNWNPVGTGPLVVGVSQALAGRTLAIAFDPNTPSTVYIGTAGGGVWKSMDSGLTWSPKTDYHMSLAIGALAIDPNNHLRIFAGTGEYNDVSAGTYYGNGILRSEDGGDTWTELATATFQRDEISRILFDPMDATSQHMFLSSATGVYESADGGLNWTQLRAGSVSDLVVIVNPGPPSSVTLIAAFYGSGLWTGTRTGTSWSPWTQIMSAAFPGSFGRIALSQSKNNLQTIYVLFAGNSSDIAGIARTSDGGSTWTAVTVRLNTAVGALSSSTMGHQHSVTIPAADLTAAPIAHAYTTSSAGSPAHTHTLSLTTSDIQQLAAGRYLTKTTDPDATAHQHSFGLKTTGQSWYNLHIAVHPTDTNTVYFGEVSIWKNSSGGGVFDRVTSLHTDNHAFAFDPVNPGIIWSCNDGGVYRSADGGTTWSHRNRDLATLEYISIALHPQWEAVMIGGTQDNGTHRYSGDPAWEISDGGDGGFTAIDPSTPTRMYHEYTGTTFYRSDSAGAPGTWALKNSGITPGASQFYAPFTLDPSNPDVCYFGGSQLWRSPAAAPGSVGHAESWSAITSTLTGIITAIAIHPTDSNTVYVGTSQGNVYRVQRTGATWNLADVTATDLTGPNLPTGLHISDLAVDTAGTVWVTVAAVLWTESTGEFSNNHVYRRLAGGSTWETRSNGLAQANPINTIVIDPTNENRLFCGGDVGVFRTEDAGANWTTWDEGLPNAPVFDLAIHGPRRLLRAATHGRSVWERPIDVAICPLVDLYMRDNILDTGRVLPSPDYQPHPFNPATNVYHWQSADIKVDAEEGSPPTFQTPTPIDDYVSFVTLQHRTARRNRTNRFYAQVHNRGVSKATNVQVRAFFCADAHAGLPPLPANFWSGGMPFSGTPPGTDWTAIGPTQTFAELEAGEPGVKEWDWFVSVTANQHSCLLTVATCTEDPLDGTGITSADYLVLNRKQAALKNLEVADPVMGMPLQPEQAFILHLRAPYEREAAGDLLFHWGSLPRETLVFVAFEVLPGNKPAVLAKPEDLKHYGIALVHRKEKLFPQKQEGRCGEIRRFDLKRIYQLSPSKDRTTTIPSVRIPYDRSLAMAINLVLPKNMKEETVQFDIIQQLGKRPVGGCTYLLRPRKKETLKRESTKQQ
jgi:photosystem II stability/assembly factor-like uncharacterized protein